MRRFEGTTSAREKAFVRILCVTMRRISSFRTKVFIVTVNFVAIFFIVFHRSKNSSPEEKVKFASGSEKPLPLFDITPFLNGNADVFNKKFGAGKVKILFVYMTIFHANFKSAMIFVFFLFFYSTMGRARSTDPSHFYSSIIYLIFYLCSLIFLLVMHVGLKPDININLKVYSMVFKLLFLLAHQSHHLSELSLQTKHVTNFNSLKKYFFLIIFPFVKGYRD
jgi:hypothetical protein